MKSEEAWRRAKGCLYDVLSGEEADEIIKALQQEPYEKFESAKDHIYKLAGDYKCWDNRLTQDEAVELCHILEQAPCTDAISRQAVLDAFWKLNVELRPDAIDAILNMVNGILPVKPQIKIGHWIYDDIANNWRCDKCGETPKTVGYVGSDEFMAEHFKFCNHCGAKMQEVE